MGIGAINKGKGKSEHKVKGKKGKGKGKKGNKGKGYGQQGYGYSGQGKGKGTGGQTVQYKGYNSYAQGKGKEQGKATVVNQATLQKTVELQSETFRTTSRKDTTMQLSSGMDHKPPVTTIGGQTAKHKSTQCSNHNNLHCQRLHN